MSNTAVRAVAGDVTNKGTRTLRGIAYTVIESPIVIPPLSVMVKVMRADGSDESVISYLSSLPKLSEVFSRRAFDSSFEVLRAIDVLMWGGADLTSLFDTRDEVTVNRDMLSHLLDTGWRLGEDVSVVEVKLFADVLSRWFPVDMVRVSEGSFVLARGAGHACSSVERIACWLCWAVHPALR